MDRFDLIEVTTWAGLTVHIDIVLWYTYRILRTISRYFFFSTRWLRPIVHIDLYKDEVKKSGIPKKNLDKNDDFVFLNKIEIIDVLGVVFVLNKAIKVYY